jgi:hypothetical protein
MTKPDDFKSIGTHLGSIRRTVLMAMVGAAALASGAIASAQQGQPAGPTPRVISVVAVYSDPARYDMVLVVVVFAPGAATPEFA